MATINVYINKNGEVIYTPPKQFEMTRTPMQKTDDDPTTLNINFELWLPLKPTMNSNGVPHIDEAGKFSSKMTLTDNNDFVFAKPILEQWVLDSTAALHLSLLAVCDDNIPKRLSAHRNEVGTDVCTVDCHAAEALKCHEVWIRELVAEMKNLGAVYVTVSTNWRTDDARAWPDSVHGAEFAKQLELFIHIPHMQELKVFKYNRNYGTSDGENTRYMEVDEVESHSRVWARWERDAGWADPAAAGGS